MYTQCPECNTAFRVTAEVLKQAAGKVRCGGCGNAFNALEFLSEKMPKQSAQKEPDAPFPELEAESLHREDGIPIAISAAQSAALLKTLDELAGSDIRIEDTGVEWRVLDDGEASEAAINEPPEESPAAVEELRFDDNTPLPDDFDLDDESSDPPESPDFDQSGTEAEAEPGLAIELLNEIEDSRVDIVFGEPDEWAEILGDVDELAEPVAAPLDVELAAIEAAEAPADMDTQFALQAEAMGINVTGSRPSLEDASEEPIFEDVDEPENEIEIEVVDEPENEFEIEVVDEPENEIEIEVVDKPENELELEVASENDAGQEDPQPYSIDEAEDQPEPDYPSIEKEIAELEEQSNVFDNEFFDAAEAAELQDEPDAAVAEDEFSVPPQTEEELTVNMMIDQDLLSFAVEDEDGFASTIVIPEKDAEDKAISEKEYEFMDDDTSSGFESIIMEGEFVRSTDNIEKLEADVAAAAGLANQAKAAREAEYAAQLGSKRYRMIGGVIALVLLLLLQVMHQSREALATIPAINSVVGPIYRAIGKPLSPAWDIRGWRFEATKGSTDENDEQLTVYSRIGNKSDQPLPYPLIRILLTDRFEETVSSRMLDPVEYLASDLDPRKPVQPGSTFNAVIAIQSPAADVTGFRLNACYRLSHDQLRCAIDDFR